MYVGGRIGAGRLRIAYRWRSAGGGGGCAESGRWGRDRIGCQGR